MRILVICNDPWHPTQTSQVGLQPLTGQGYTFDFVEDGRDWPALRLEDYPVVLFTKSNNISNTEREPWETPAVEADLTRHVEQGGGLLVVHSGTVLNPRPPQLAALIGGVFVQHPPQCDVTVTPRPDHPLTAGVEPFTQRDEHYHMEMLETPADLFLTTSSEHGEQPGGWTRQVGAGRVCVLTPGHNVEVWLHPAMQTLLGNALRWCAQA
jgi:type 1 glutamine amidotransferase